MGYRIEDAVSSVPVATLDTTIGMAIALMKEHQLLELPLVTNGIYEGLIFLEDIEHTDDLDAYISITLVRKPIIYTNKNLHILEAVKMMTTLDITIIPVLDDAHQYIGAVAIDQGLKTVSDMMGISLTGSIIILRVLTINYSPAEIVRLVESNDMKLITFGVTTIEEGSALQVTIKVDKEDIAGLLATFYRYEYEVVDSFSSLRHQDHYQDRYAQLMKYLEL